MCSIPAENEGKLRYLSSLLPGSISNIRSRGTRNVPLAEKSMSKLNHTEEKEGDMTI